MQKRSVDLTDISQEYYKKLRITNDAAEESILEISDEKFVLTFRFLHVLERLLLCLKSDIPLLLEGPPGCGKSTLLAILFHLCEKGPEWKKDPIWLSVGEQSDPKVLIGTYVAKSDGQFVWTPGILTRAVREGRWVIFDGLQSASPEYISLLAPLLQTGTLNTSIGEIKAHKDFKVFATSTDGSCAGLSQFFLRLYLDMPTNTELFTILQHKFGDLPVELLRISFKLYERFIDSQGNNSNISFQLFRFYQRLSLVGIDRTLQGLDVSVRSRLLIEFCDCFLSNWPLERRSAEINRLFDVVALTESDGNDIFNKRIPQIEFKADSSCVNIGRTSFEIKGVPFTELNAMADTMLSRQVIEKIAVCVKMNEPVLLVGETGTGKTTMVQFLSKLLGQSSLIILNLSQQTEGSDLLGGFRPLSLPVAAKLLVERFECLFGKTFSKSKNTMYLSHVISAFQNKSWERLIKLMFQVIELAKSKNSSLVEEWAELERKLHSFLSQVKAGANAAFFAFIEGALVKAIEEGYWILLDEINLASSETLDILSGILSPQSSIFLSDRGDCEPLKRHPNFRLFACMNPATDVSKKNLPPHIRRHFTECYVDETDVVMDDLRKIIGHYMEGVRGSSPTAREAILNIYYTWKEAVKSHNIVDGSRKVPLLNLRTLNRALRYAKLCEPLYGFARSLYEGLSMTFLTTLDESSAIEAQKVIVEHLSPFGLQSKSLDSFPKLNMAAAKTLFSGNFIVFEDAYTVPLGPEKPQSESLLNEHFILTPSVRRNVANLARALMSGQSPILLEGPTSAGKTSVIEYLAKLSGHRFVRINNHEHTDIQEYIGAYQPDSEGKLVFKEGLLVEALRKGYWIVLDELNLAPSDVLEALNRLLDDNRELYVPEIGEVVKPHVSFGLFATQNPAGIYGGRKVLSKAFRSRFIELQCNELPTNEIEAILSKRCGIAPSHAAKISKVYSELQQRRTGSNVFAGRNSLVTLRDLFRWASRPMVTAEDLALNGLAVLGERLRHEEEKKVVLDIIGSIFKVKIDYNILYSADNSLFASHLTTWTKPMKRLFSLVLKAVTNKEPVLLVGETGCGKTTVCQVLAQVLQRKLVILNCHQNSETSDFLGSLRPSCSAEVEGPQFEWKDGPLVNAMREGNIILLDEISLADDSVLERLNSVLENSRTLTLAEAIHGEEIVAHPNFVILATMNPGGDFGKKELSPALRNRFTEIWVPSIGDEEDILMIIEEKVGDRELAVSMIEFIKWWKSQIDLCLPLKRWPFSIRDILSWASFADKLGKSNISIIQAATAIFVDPAYSIASIVDSQVGKFVEDCKIRLNELFPSGELINFGHEMSLYSNDRQFFGPDLFKIPTVASLIKEDSFCFNSPTSFASMIRILRAMHLGRSILLEGSPGVGKTSIVTAIAKATGHELYRINLSEQTDLMDLFGTDMPQDGGFKWIDGPLLRALKRGAWILLDELNLASQSVLEGLNACLDHRGEVYIPELDRTFTVPTGTCIFGAQNPIKQGGGRKGLPKSFLNRFITVWIDPLTCSDMEIILGQKASFIPESVRKDAISFIVEAQKGVEAREFGLKGAPWEFNLRDLFRWINLCSLYPQLPAETLLPIIFLPRMRLSSDVSALFSIMKLIFPFVDQKYPLTYKILGNSLIIGSVEISMDKFKGSDFTLIPSQLPSLESLIASIQCGWLSILYGKGKSSLIRLIADIMGQTVSQITLSSSSDIADLLGTFEQTSVEEELDAILQEGSQLLGKPITENDLNNDIRLSDLRSRWNIIKSQGDRLVFSWKDGPLVKALLNGNWIILDNANSCPSSVLDRLNSLFEPNGFIALNEASSLEPRIIKAHPDSRVFMTCSGPAELSRAMRNRGLEICLLSPELDDLKILEEALIIAAASKSSLQSASQLLPKSDNISTLSKLGKLSQTVPNHTIDAHFENTRQVDPFGPDLSFWIRSPIAPFGSCSSFLNSVLEWTRSNFRAENDQVWNFIGEPSTFVAINKAGRLCEPGSNEKLQVLKVAEIDLDIDQKAWKTQWKRDMACLLLTLDSEIQLLKMIESLPPCNNIFAQVDMLCSVKQVSTSISQILANADSNSQLSPLTNYLKKVSWLKNVKSFGMKGGLCCVKGTLNLDSVLTEVYGSYMSALKNLTAGQLASQSSTKSILLSNLTTLFSISQNNKNVNWINSVENGVSLFLKLVSSYTSLDPILFYRQKLLNMKFISSINNDLLRIQSMLRFFLFGVKDIPQEILDIAREVSEKVDRYIHYIIPEEETDSRKKIVSMIGDVQKGAIFTIVQRYLNGEAIPIENLLLNLASFRQKLTSFSQFSLDITLPLLSALDEVIYGLEMSTVKYAKLECPVLNVFEPSRSLRQALLRTRLLKSLGFSNFLIALDYADIKGKIGELYKIEKQLSDETSPLLYDGSDEEIREVRINNMLFGESCKENTVNEHIDEMATLIDNVLDPKYSDDAESVLIDLVQSQEENNSVSIREFIERAYRNKQKSSGFNIYKDSNYSEVMFAVEVIKEFQKALVPRLEEYPEHDVLSSLSLQCERFLSSPASSPLISFLTAMEVLITKANVWQEYADKTRKLPVDALYSVVIKWRKLELENWRSVIASMDVGYQKAAMRKLFWLIQVSQETSAKGKEMIELLDTFILSAPLGELFYRLDMVLKVSRYSTTSPEISSIFTKVHQYYTIIVRERLESYVKEHRRVISNDLKAAIIETVWRDTSYWIVKQTVEKTHKAITKQVRKYRDLLDQPVSIILTRVSISNEVEAIKEAERKKFKSAANMKMTSLEHRLVNIAAQRLASSLTKFDNVLRPENLNLLSTSIIERVAELASLTDSAGVQIKQKAFVDLGKVLKSMGLNLYSQPLLEESSVSYLLSKFASNCKNATGIDSKISEYISRSLSIWHGISTMEVNADIGVRQAELSRNIVFRLLELCQRQSSLVFMDLSSSRKLLETLDSRTKSSKMTSVNTEILEKTRSEVEVLSVLVKEADLLLQPHVDYLPSEFSQTSDYLSSLKSFIDGLLKDTSPQEGLVSWLPDHLIESINYRIERVVEVVKCLDNCPLDIKDFIEPITAQTCKLSPIAVLSLSVESQVDCHTNLLLLVQEIEASIKEETVTDNEYNLYDGYLNKSLNAILSLNIPSLVSRCKSILLQCNSQVNTEKLEETVQLANVILSFLQQAASIVELCHRSTAKLTLVCSSVIRTIFQKGFCRPVEQTEEKNEGRGDEIETGTGMGEGQGEQNVSKEIDFEEQITDLLNDQSTLEDLKKEDDDEQKEQESKEEDEKIEMREDFNAQTEDSNNPDEMGDDEEEQVNEAEDEMGEANNGKQNELDDGWNEDIEENKSENESDSDVNSELDDEEAQEESGKKDEEETGELAADQDNKNEMDLDNKGKEEFGASNEKEEKEENVEQTSEKEDEENEEEGEEGDEEEKETAEACDQEMEEDPKESETAAEGEEKNEMMEIDENSRISDEEGEEDDDYTESKDEHYNKDMEEAENEEENQHGSTDFDSNQTQNIPENQQKDQSLTADRFGASSRTVNHQGTSASQSDKPTRNPPKSTPIDEVMEKIRNTIHQVMGKTHEDVNKKEESIEGLDSKDSRQLYEEKDDANEFAMGATHQEDQNSIEKLPEMNEMGDEERSEVDSEADDIADRMEIDENVEKELAVKEISNPTYQPAVSKSEEEEVGDGDMKDDITILPSWDEVEQRTLPLAMELCEQLRLVLEPTKATKLRGDYRTGKRLNLRKIPSYIASHYRRDKIWLRRTKPSARTYRIAISVDNSRSMKGAAGILALDALAATATALCRLEAGQLAVSLFGSQIQLLHPFEQPWTTESGRTVFQNINFEEEHTDLVSLLAKVNEMRGDEWQLHVILSDGICQDHQKLATLVNEGLANKIIHLFVVLDPTIADIQHVEYTNQGIKMTKYLQTFPFQIYVILKDLQLLPMVLADSILQWFETIALLE